MRMLTDAPAAKVNAAGIAALLTPLILALLRRYVYLDTPLPDIAEDVISSLIVAGVTYAAGYLKRPAAQDRVVPDAPDAPGIPPA